MRKATMVPLSFAGNPDEGTLSRYTSDSGFTCLIWELPDRGNQHGKSKINRPGKYVCKMQPSNEFHKDLYHLQDVPGRDHVMIHNGNVAGDVDKGYATDALGCLLTGDSVGVFQKGSALGHNKDGTPRILKRDQHGVTNSKNTLAALMADMGGADFELTIQ